MGINIKPWSQAKLYREPSPNCHSTESPASHLDIRAWAPDTTTISADIASKLWGQQLAYMQRFICHPHTWMQVLMM